VFAERVMSFFFSFLFYVLHLLRIKYGGAENDGHENDGPSKLQGMNLQDMKTMKSQFT